MRRPRRATIEGALERTRRESTHTSDDVFDLLRKLGWYAAPKSSEEEKLIEAALEVLLGDSE